MKKNRSNSPKKNTSSDESVTIINIDARANNQDNPVVEFFSPGTYEVKFIGTTEGGRYDAWSRWSFIYECNESGENCTTGWLNEYYVISSEFNIKIKTSGIYATPEQAKDKAQSTSFTLHSNKPVQFFIGDDLLSDNRGGVSLAVRKIYQPASTSFLGNLVFGALLIGSILITWFILDP